MPRGGYRKPSNPAPVSGPGRLSRRTDGGPIQAAKDMTGGKYGENKQLNDLQAQAPMAAAPKPKLQRQAVGLFEPTQYPSEPVTAGMPFGPGPGPEVVTKPNEHANSLSSALQKILPNDLTGDVTELYNYLISRGM